MTVAARGPRTAEAAVLKMLHDAASQLQIPQITALIDTAALMAKEDTSE